MEAVAAGVLLARVIVGAAVALVIAELLRQR